MFWTVVQFIGVYGPLVQGFFAMLPPKVFWTLFGWLLIPDPAIRHR